MYSTFGYPSNVVLCILAGQWTAKMPVVKVLQPEYHRPHIPDIFPCFNPFTDRIWGEKMVYCATAWPVNKKEVKENVKT